MSWFRALRYRLRAVLNSEERERDLDAEFAFHKEMEMRANLNRGLDPDDARRSAQRDFGNEAAVRDALRDANSAGVLSSLAQDARFALRRVWRERTFSSIIVLTLALGIGWATAIASVIDTALVRPLAYTSPDQLVHLWSRREGSTMTRGELSAPELADLRRIDRLFSAVAAYRQAGFSLLAAAGTDRVNGARVSANFFSVLGVRPALGRSFEASDDVVGAPMTALLSDDAWHSRFGGDPSIVGKVAAIDGRQATIIGVLPATFRFVLATNAQLWVPIQIDPSDNDRGNRWIRSIARLQPGVPFERARREFDDVMRRMAAEHPDVSAGRAGNLVSLRDEMVGGNRAVLFTLLIGVAALLLTGCANVAGLLLARVAGRASELAVRRAIGAESARIIGQTLIENLVLALTGGILGIGVAFAALRILLAQVPPALVAAFPFVATTTLDGRVIALALVLSIATGLLCGIVPAIAASRHAPSELLRAGSRAVAAKARWRQTLVAGQLALTFVLVACSSLLGRSLAELFRTSLGFNPERVLTFGISFDGPRYAGASSRAVVSDEIARRLREMPGVDGVAVGSDLPLEYGASGSFTIGGDARPGDEPYARFRWADAEYFRTLGIPMKNGRGFLPTDTTNIGGVIVSESMLRQYAGRGAALGATVGYDNDGRHPIVGVVGDIRMEVDQDPTPTIYLPLVPGQLASLRYGLRSRGDPAALTTAVRQVIAAIDPGLLVESPRTMREEIDGSRAIFFRRFPMLVTSAFSVVGLVLAAIGLFGIVAHAVAQRTREFGIRMALGASRGSVVGLSVRDGLYATGVGVVAGLALVLLAGRALSSLLYGVQSADPLNYLTTTAIIAATALAASAIPARRAVAISPSAAMRDAG